MSYRNFLLILSLFSILLFSPVSNIFASSSLYFTKPPVVSTGDRVTVFLRVRTTNQSINAISGIVSYPENLLKPISVSKDSSIISLWTGEPKISRGKVSFEGVVLNPGFSGNNGLVLKIVFEARNKGLASLNFTEGSILANDGLGSNVLTSLIATNFQIIDVVLNNNNIKLPVKEIVKIDILPDTKLAKLPVITEYSASVDAQDKLFLTGKGEPNTLTKIIFKDVTLKSLGEELLNRLQNKKTKLDSVLVKNDENGYFKYTSNSNLIAGVYNATPFLINQEENIEKPGLGVQLFVNDSKIVKNLIVLINVLGLFIPIVLLCVIIYFIPWYSWLRMRVLKKKIGLEEEKIEISGINLAREGNLLNQKKDNINENTKNQL